MARRYGLVLVGWAMMITTTTTSWQVSSALELTTVAKSKLSNRNLQEFLATPSNWPTIVASSNRVTTSNGNPSVPVKRGDRIEEFFGLNLLSVEWTCMEKTLPPSTQRRSRIGKRKEQQSTLLFSAPEGVPGIANECTMKFDITTTPLDEGLAEEEEEDVEVKLTMGFNPLSPLAVLATPVLIVDNWIALNVLLPAAVDTTPLDSFRKLMGTLYGIAGLAHLADLLIGPSTLLVAAGTPVFMDLPPIGQAYALLWCVSGPIAYFASQRESTKSADFGLLQYGLIEVVGAYLTGNVDAVQNAIGVQVVVILAWMFSQKKQQSMSIQNYK